MKPETIEEIRAKWAEWGSLLGSAIDSDKCVNVPARHCEGAVLAFLVGAPRDVEALFKALAVERAVSAFWRARSQYLLDSDACALAQKSGAPPEHVEIMRSAARRAFEREVAASKRCADLGVNPWLEAEAEDRADEVTP